MSSLIYVGSKATTPEAIAVKKNVDDTKATGLTQVQIDSRIASRLSGYASRDYADQQDSLRATVDYVNAQDALRIKLADRNRSNGGLVGLDSGGNIPLSRIPASMRTFQRGHRAYYSPSGYNSNYTRSTSGEITLYSLSIPDPGMSYRILVWGYMESMGGGNGGSEHCAVYVRANSAASGQIVAEGRSPWRADWGALDIMPNNTSNQYARTGSTTLYIRGSRGGSGTQSVIFGGFLPNLCVMLIPA